MREVDVNQWKVNYLWRLKCLTEEELKSFRQQKLEPQYKEREVQRITLKKYIEFIGTDPAAELFDCSSASTKAWRYGLRQPSIKQAKKIIKASGGKLDFESIFGPIEENGED
jgi:hypothetical protein|tara:strand:- start:1051 stop:1386 length:336 start_codon:yes stop_codon:yes gene_type:complete